MESVAELVQVVGFGIGISIYLFGFPLAMGMVILTVLDAHKNGIFVRFTAMAAVVIGIIVLTAQFELSLLTFCLIAILLAARLLMNVTRTRKTVFLCSGVIVGAVATLVYVLPSAFGQELGPSSAISMAFLFFAPAIAARLLHRTAVLQMVRT